jgi:hypothetical protein
LALAGGGGGGAPAAEIAGSRSAWHTYKASATSAFAFRPRSARKQRPRTRGPERLHVVGRRCRRLPPWRRCCSGKEAMTSKESSTTATISMRTACCALCANAARDPPTHGAWPLGRSFGKAYERLTRWKTKISIALLCKIGFHRYRTIQRWHSDEVTALEGQPAEPEVDAKQQRGVGCRVCVFCSRQKS